MADEVWDCAVVGAGPAGLAAAARLAGVGRDTVVVDAGKPQAARVRGVPEDLVAGVGGAGLFSDGKFSYWPSATRLWQLRPADTLASAYAWTREQLCSHGIDAPALGRALGDAAPERLDDMTVRKSYDSVYAPPEARHALVESWTALSGVAVVTHRRVETIAAGADGLVHLVSQGRTTVARAVLLASGRLGALDVQSLLPAGSTYFSRVEVGVRVVQPADAFFLREYAELDPKLIVGVPRTGLEWRTFCVCRDGMVEAGRLNGVLTASGRADCPPTGESNVGWLLRMTDRDVGLRALSDALRANASLDRLVREPLATFLASAGGNRPSALADAIGRECTPGLAHGLRLLVERFPALGGAEVQLVGPCLEGVGSYPGAGPDLRTDGTAPIWVAGDVTGRFRGLTAAIVSGAHAADRIAAYLSDRS